jgi:NADPH:quinone reductase-like Zn-dependent oxidoreductase
MKAYVLSSYGTAELAEIAQPVPADDEVLIRVRATSVNPYDWHHLRGEPYVARLMPGTLGLRRPGLSILGCDVAGQVEATGADVTGFQPGDDVYALIEQGGFAEYVCVKADLLARKPANLSYEQAAAVPMAAVTALLGLRDDGRIEPGQRVMVTGASGGVGTYAVQLGRTFGASVTAQTRSANADLVGSLGAAEVVTDLPADRRYDLVLDIAGTRSLLTWRRMLEPKGTYVAVGGPPGRWLQPAGHVMASMAFGSLLSQRVAMTDTVAYAAKKQALDTLTGLIESGEITPVVGQRYSFGDALQALADQEHSHPRGKLVVTV